MIPVRVSVRSGRLLSLDHVSCDILVLLRQNLDSDARRSAGSAAPHLASFVEQFLSRCGGPHFQAS